MITDEQLLLITAAVDGELSPLEALRFRKLLDASSQAQDLFSRLQQDCLRLRNLPVVPPPADLQQRLMMKLASVTPAPTIRCQGSAASILAVANERAGSSRPSVAHATAPNTTKSKSRNGLLQFALAASILLAISGSSFWFFSRSTGPQQSFARSSSRPAASNVASAGNSESSKSLPSDAASRPNAPVALPAESITSRTDSSDARTPKIHANEVAIAPSPRATHNPYIMGAEVSPEGPAIDLIRVRVPFLRSLSEFELDETRKLFVEELARDPAFRIDVFTRHLPRSIEWLRSATKNAGLTMAVDATTLDRVNKAQVTSFAIYTEALTGAELADLFAKLCSEDSKISPRVFDAIHATPIVQADQDSLRSILGIDPGLYKRTAQEKSAEGPKSISAGTADQIVKSLTSGQGKASEKTAILLSWLPLAARTAPNSSAELKQFLGKRIERKPNAVPALIVIRQG